MPQPLDDSGSRSASDGNAESSSIPTNDASRRGCNSMDLQTRCLGCLESASGRRAKISRAHGPPPSHRPAPFSFQQQKNQQSYKLLLQLSHSRQRPGSLMCRRKGASARFLYQLFARKTPGGLSLLRWQRVVVRILAAHPRHVAAATAATAALRRNKICAAGTEDFLLGGKCVRDTRGLRQLSLWA